MKPIFHVVCYQLAKRSVVSETYKLLLYVKYNWPERRNSTPPPPPQHHKEIQRLKLWKGSDEWHVSSISHIG